MAGSDERSTPILIVDDQVKLVRLITELMNRLGFPRGRGRDDGPQALEQLRSKRYGLVISDLDMEPMDGIQLLREIRADDVLMNMPFILTETSFSFEDINVRTLPVPTPSSSSRSTCRS